MSFYRYSPWEDAAQYGQGLGQALSQAIIQRPQRQMEMRQQQARFPLEQDLLRAQIQSALTQPELRKLMLQVAQTRADTGKENAESSKVYRGKMGDAAETNAKTRQDTLKEREGIDKQRLELYGKRTQTQEDLNRIRAAIADADIGLKQAQKDKIEKGPNETSPQVDAQFKRAIETQKLLGSTLPGGTNTVPSVAAAQYAQERQQQNPGVSLADILKSIMTPNLQTNKTYMGLGPDEVVTNGAKFTVPPSAPVHAQPMLNAPAPWTPPQPMPTGEPHPTIIRNPKTGQRLQLINGQWTPIQ